MNSSKPPSSDGFKPRVNRQRRKRERSSGGQSGHRGQTLEWSAEVHQIEPHRVEACRVCGASLNEVEVESWDLRQVRDIAPIELRVTEHQAEVTCCLQCQTLNREEFPPDVTSVVQYGVSLKGLMQQVACAKARDRAPSTQTSYSGLRSAITP
ncbi:MAG: DUF6444 domain-containing protein [Elainellaceae cyanobacterium]